MKESVKILCEVSGPDGSDALYAVVTVGAALLQQIKTLSALVRDRRVYSVTLFDYSADMYDAVPEGTFDWINVVGDVPECTAALAPLPMELMELHVTDDSCHWSAVPKHGSAGETVETPPIPIRWLEDLFKEEPENV